MQVSDSLDLAERAIALQASSFHLAIQGAATEFFCAATDESIKRRARFKALNGNRALRLLRDTRPNQSLLALMLSWRAAIAGALLALRANSWRVQIT
jgi:hypothetical protein